MSIEIDKRLRAESSREGHPNYGEQADGGLSPASMPPAEIGDWGTRRGLGIEVALRISADRQIYDGAGPATMSG